MTFFNLVEILSLVGAVLVVSDLAFLSKSQDKRLPLRILTEDNSNYRR